MAGYTRQSSGDIVDGAVVEAAPVNAEYNQLQAAFHSATGHPHDGETGNGPKISLTGSVTGILPVANGGTGLATLATGKVLVGAGTSVVSVTKAAPTGDFVGTTDNQTLANKTLTSPTISGATLTTSDLSGTFTGTLTSTSATITGGTITGITDLTVADGGTGASTAAGARTNLGLGTMAVETATDYVTVSSYTGADILTKLKTVDGAGSGLDADLLDGQSSAYYLSLTNATGTIPETNLPNRLKGAGVAFYTGSMDDLTDNGFYFINSTASNKPIANFGYCIVLNLDATGRCKQLWYDYNSRKSYERQNNPAGTWTQWEETTSNLSYLDGRYLGISAKAANSDLLDGQSSAFYQNAGNLNAGTIPSARLAGTYSINISGNANTLDALTSSQFLRSDTSDTTSGTLTASGGFISGNQSFQTSTTNLILGNNGAAGGVYLRPNGVSSGAGQAYVNSAGTFTASGNVTAYSDARLKTGVETLDGSLDRIGRMRGVSYIKDGEKQIGVIAQEMQEVRPEVVIEGKYDEELGFAPLTVSYGNLVAELIEAVKELTARVKELESR